MLELRKHRTIILAAVITVIFIAQLYVPFSVVGRHNDILANGEQFKFRINTISKDDLKNRAYIDLRVMADIKNPGENLGGQVYAIINIDSGGIAYIESVSKERPSHGRFLILEQHDIDSVILPFDRYHFKWDDQELLNKSYVKNDRRSYISVRVKDGSGVIDGLFIDNIPAEAYR